MAPATNWLGISILVGTLLCWVSGCDTAQRRDPAGNPGASDTVLPVADSSAASPAAASAADRNKPPTLASMLAERSATDAELDALARGLRNEALQVTRAKELAGFSMEPDTHTAALRAQTPDVTMSQAAAVVGLDLARYRLLRQTVETASAAAASSTPPLPSEMAIPPSMARAVAAWHEYKAAQAAEGPLH